MSTNTAQVLATPPGSDERRTQLERTGVAVGSGDARVFHGAVCATCTHPGHDANDCPWPDLSAPGWGR